jgi:hypothetical protein
VTLIRKEIREFESRDRAGHLMYPGRWIVIWIKTPQRRHGAGGAGPRLAEIIGRHWRLPTLRVDRNFGRPPYGDIWIWVLPSLSLLSRV